MGNDSKEGDKVMKREPRGFQKPKVMKVKPDGTRVTKDKTGKISSQKDPRLPRQPMI